MSAIRAIFQWQVVAGNRLMPTGCTIGGLPSTQSGISLFQKADAWECST